jgi:glycosyltransferase involved in cell wall biosynthesis
MSLTLRKSKKADSLPRVSIGLPTYNRPELLALVLENFRQQTFSDFEIIISDNASPDPRVRIVAEEFSRSDDRFVYIRQAQNQGMLANFWYVYDRARAPLFLWASDDDVWSPTFLEQGVAALDRNAAVSAWFGQLVNINPTGTVVRTYPSYQRFQPKRLKAADLVGYLWEPEIMGKANLFYSMFRREAVRETLERFRGVPDTTWGIDMIVAYGIMCRHNFVICDDVVMQKRIRTEFADDPAKPRKNIYPWEERRSYFGNYKIAAENSGYEVLTAVVLAARSAYDYWFSGQVRNSRSWRFAKRFLMRLRSAWLRAFYHPSRD